MSQRPRTPCGYAEIAIAVTVAITTTLYLALWVAFAPPVVTVGALGRAADVTILPVSAKKSREPADIDTLHIPVHPIWDPKPSNIYTPTNPTNPTNHRRQNQ